MIDIIISSVYVFTNIFVALIIVRALLSWFPPPSRDSAFFNIYHGVIILANFVTEPIVSPIRSLLQKSPLGGPGMFIDFSPLFALILIQFASRILISFLMGL